jgi:phosphoglycerate dehydrogenase-like enzyme
MSIVIWPPESEAWAADIRDAAGRMPVVTPTNEREALAAAPEAEGWVGRLTPELLAAARKLRWLQAPSISLESVVFPELIASDVTLTNMRHIYDDHIANHVMTLFLALCRDLPKLVRSQIAGTWLPHDNVHVYDPGEMTLLVMGLGGIGSEAARRLSVLGPRIIGVDPKIESAPPGVTELARPTELAALLPRVDATIICAPLTPETMGLFDDALFARMKPGALFVNIGRGKIVRLDALEQALRSGRVAAAALDVFETEPLPAESPLWGMANVLITPHVADSGPHTEERRERVVLENVRRFAGGEPLINVTDKARWY